MSKKKSPGNRRKKSMSFTRRELLTYSAAIGAFAAASGLGEARENQPLKAGREAKNRRPRQTIFFNFSHEADADTAQYYVVGGGSRYRLRRVGQNSPVLRRARQNNAFLKQVPDAAITHAANIDSPDSDGVDLHYVIKNPDSKTGAWSMSSMYFHLPARAVSAAYARAAGRVAKALLPLSAKRQGYGLGAARTARDFLEEEALKDSTDHAAAVIGLHPELLSAEPISAAHLQKNHIGTSAATLFLGNALRQAGAAMPEESENKPNATGWATLTPIPDDNGKPFKNRNGKNKGLIQYHPEWSPRITPFARDGVFGVMNRVKDDPMLGADLTGLDPDGANADIAGAIWHRLDGFATVDQSPPGQGAAADSLRYTLKRQTWQSGFKCEGSATAQKDGTVRATLTFTNWFVRWLGIYILFLDANDNPLDASGLPIKIPADYDPGDGSRETLASEKALFGLLLGPEFTLLGIPVLNATAVVTFEIPEQASKVRLFASGPSFYDLNAPDPKDPSTWGDPFPGFVSTALLNYGLPILLMVAGASKFLSPIQKAALPFAASIVVDATNLIGDAFRNRDFGKPNAWSQVGLATLKAFLASLTGAKVQQLALLIAAAIAEGEAEDSVPLAGQIAQAVSILAGVATLLETTLEIAASPKTYAYELVLTHDLSVTIRHDRKNDQFPSAADYYRVTALFDNGGTPYNQQLRLPGTSVSTLPPVVFRNVPEGGRVNVSVGFYSRASGKGRDDRLVAKGSTGLVANTVGKDLTLTIEQFKVPIQANTVYVHKQITSLDARGNRCWAESPAPAVKEKDIACRGAGTLCRFRSITVRQGTSAAPGYVGYAWQGFSSGVAGCASGAKGQLDQLANIGDVNAQGGYAALPCGLLAGAQLSYSLLTHESANFYLDSNNNLVRQVRLDSSPAFADPRSSNQAWGALNLDSDALLLHPSGRLVSINNANSKMEVLCIPDAPLSDLEARNNLLAEVYSGQGRRPGLMDSPCAATVSPQGAILILEKNNNRLQAFDLGGNPVPLFPGQPSPYFLNLDATAGQDTVYLGLAAEFSGYLYVLSYHLGTNRYRLDIYHPGQADTRPISTTLDVNAARLTVDFWRNVYTLNYQVLKLPDGTVPGITEPSVSKWVPSAPS